jgi:hypothetical protein
MKEETKDRGMIYSADNGLVYHSHDHERGMSYLDEEVGELIRVMFPENYGGWCRSRMGGNKGIHCIIVTPCSLFS